MHATTIVAYTYNAETLCPRCVCGALNIGEPINRDGYAYRGVVEAGLNELAARTGIDRQDERTFDSGDFPKVVFADQIEDEHEFCDSCGEALL